MVIIMKFLDEALDRAIKFSAPVKKLVETINILCDTTTQLTHTLANVLHNQRLHAYAINQLALTQAAILKKLNDNALDTSMPDIDVTSTSDVDQDDKKHKKSSSKPN